MIRTPADALRAWRLALGYTHRQVGAVFGVTREAPRHWEKGTVQVPQRVQARLRAEGWCVPTGARFGWTPADDARLLTGHRAGHAFATLEATFARAGRPRSAGALRQRLYKLRRQDGEPRRRPPPRRTGPRCNVWTPEQDAWLREHAGEAPLAELAQRMTVACGVPRSAGALHRRLTVLQVSRLSRHLTGHQVGYYCGVSSTTVRKWIARGWLVLPAWATPRPGAAATIPREAVAAFIATHAVQLQVGHMPPSPYRDQAAAIWARERWLDMTTAARYVGLTPGWLRKLVREGQVPATQAYRQGAHRWWMIRARDLAGFSKERRVAS